MSTGPKRVLYIDPVGEKGGAEVVLLDLVKRLDRDRFTPVVVCLRPGPFVEELTRLGIRAFALPPHRVRQPRRVAATIRSLEAIVRAERIDVLHANSGHLLFYASMAARRSGASVVWHPHDPLDRRGAFERLFLALQRPLRPDWTIFANPAVASSYLEAYPRIGRNSVALPGVDPGEIEGGDGASARDALGVPRDAPLVTMFARLQAHKGHLDLLEAAARLRGAHPDARYVLCGGTLFGRQPQYAEQVLARATELALGDRVVLPGFVSDREKRDLLAASTLVAHPATYEPFGIAVLEAMAAGKPVVACDVAGPSHTVVHGETGFLVPPGDPEALAAALDKVLGTPEIADALGEAGRRRVDEQFCVDAMVREIESVYDEVLGGR